MNKPARIAPPEQTDFSARFTTAEFLRMADTGAFDNMKVELVAGELIRMNLPRNEHSRLQMLVGLRLGAVIEEHLLRGDTGIDLGRNTVLACDVAILRQAVSGQRLLRPGEVLLAVEIAMSTLDRDLGMKRRAYAAAGIAHYWVVDGKRRVVHVFSRIADDDYADIGLVRFGDPVAVPDADRTITLD